MMDDLLSSIEKCLVTPKDDLFSTRKELFKYCGKTIDLNREKRRRILLDEYKRKRHALINEKRGLLNDEFDESEEWMDWKEFQVKNSKHKRWVNYNCKNQLMLSEWLLDRPQDLETSWTLVLCPEGQRVLVVAKKGHTRAYHKNGILLANFKSILPNGSPSYQLKNSELVILDCIWKKKTKQLFALDVLHWKNQTLLNCDAQFRLYWLQSKLKEVKQCSTRQEHEYDVFIPHHCTLSTVVEGLTEHDPAEVDGILFYHNSAPYISGHTPLVGWLKPFMLAERFGLEVPNEYLALKPDTYVDLEQWVAEVSHSHTRNGRRKKDQEGMDTSDAQSGDTSSDIVGEPEDICSSDS